MDCFAAPAMTVETSDSNFKQREGMPSLSRGAMRPRFCINFTLLDKRRAQGKPGADCTRGRAQECTSRPQGNRINPAFPARMGYGLLRALPGVTSSLAPVALGLTMHPKPRSGRMHLPKLGASLGRQVHTSIFWTSVRHR